MINLLKQKKLQNKVRALKNLKFKSKKVVKLFLLLHQFKLLKNN